MKWTGLKGIKHIELILLVLAAGVLFYVIGQPQAEQSAATSQEKRLAQVLEQIEGAGTVEVYLAYDGQSADSVYAFSTQSSGEKQITGVIIVASGASDTGVKLRLAQAARTALGVDANRISVFERRQEEN